jgi:hypothetical protein
MGSGSIQSALRPRYGPFRCGWERRPAPSPSTAIPSASRRSTEVALSVADAAQNVVILGAIGSGKTTRAVNPLLVQLLAQDCGGLVFDIKGDFGGTVAVLASEAGRAVRTIGPGHERMNLLDGLTPEVAASFLKSAFLLSAARGDRFWVDTAAELCRNALGVLRYLPGRYALDGLYRYLFEQKTREAWDREVTDTLLSLSLDARDRDERLLRSYLAYHEDVFAHFEPKVQSNVNAQVARVLSPFNHPDLVDAFCVESGTQARMEAVLDGTVYLVALPLALVHQAAVLQSHAAPAARKDLEPKPPGLLPLRRVSGNRELRQGRRIGPQLLGQVAFERLHRRHLADGGPSRNLHQLHETLSGAKAVPKRNPSGMNRRPRHEAALRVPKSRPET